MDSRTTTLTGATDTTSVFAETAGKFTCAPCIITAFALAAKLFGRNMCLLINAINGKRSIVMHSETVERCDLCKKMLCEDCAKVEGVRYLLQESNVAFWSRNQHVIGRRRIEVHLFCCPETLRQHFPEATRRNARFAQRLVIQSKLQRQHFLIFKLHPQKIIQSLFTLFHCTIHHVRVLNDEISEGIKSWRQSRKSKKRRSLITEMKQCLASNPHVSRELHSASVLISFSCTLPSLS